MTLDGTRTQTRGNLATSIRGSVAKPEAQQISNWFHLVLIYCIATILLVSLASIEPICLKKYIVVLAIMSCVVYLREDASNVRRKLCTGERVRMNCLETLNRKKCIIMQNLITEFKCSVTVLEYGRLITDK